MMTTNATKGKTVARMAVSRVESVSPAVVMGLFERLVILGVEGPGAM